MDIDEMLRQQRENIHTIKASNHLLVTITKSYRGIQSEIKNLSITPQSDQQLHSNQNISGVTLNDLEQESQNITSYANLISRTMQKRGVRRNQLYTLVFVFVVGILTFLAFFGCILLYRFG